MSGTWGIDVSFIAVNLVHALDANLNWFMDALKGKVEEERLILVAPPGRVLDDVHSLPAEQVCAVLALALVGDVLPVPEVITKKPLCTVTGYPGNEKLEIHYLNLAAIASRLLCKRNLLSIDGKEWHLIWTNLS